MNVNVDFEITDAALDQVKKSMSENMILRVFVQGGGCSGTNYSLALVDSDDVSPVTDIMHEFRGVKVVVDKKGLFLLDGTTMDWEEGPSSSGFKFNAPKSNCCKKSCNS